MFGKNGDAQSLGLSLTYSLENYSLMMSTILEWLTVLLEYLDFKVRFASKGYFKLPTISNCWITSLVIFSILWPIHAYIHLYYSFYKLPSLLCPNGVIEQSHLDGLLIAKVKTNPDTNDRNTKLAPKM